MDTNDLKALLEIHKTSIQKKIWYSIYRFFSKIFDIPNALYMFYQRGRRGYSDNDVWNLNNYLSSWMPQALRQLKKIGHGCPVDFYNKKYVGNECKEWGDILEKMAEGFDILNQEEALNDTFNEWSLGTAPASSSSINEWSLEKMQVLEKERKEKMQLFVDNYMGLWD